MKKMKVNFLNKSKLDLSCKYLTEDNLIDVAQKQFLKQQEQLADLQNHLRTFAKGVKDVTDTMDNMYSCFKNIYEPNWVGNIEFNKICQESIKILRQFVVDIKFNISKAVNEYGEEFPDMKRSIDKRNKKLIELSKQRRIYENYRNGKKVDEVKIKKVKLELDQIDRDYQTQNNVLKETLPKLCDKRIRIYVDLWMKLFDAEGAMFSFLHESRRNQLSTLSKLSDIAESDEYSIRAQLNLGNDYGTNLLSTKAYAKSAMSLFSADFQPLDLSTVQPKTPVYSNNSDNQSLSNGVGVTADLGSNRAKSYQVNNRLSPTVSVTSAKNYQIISRASPSISDSPSAGFFRLPSDKVSLTKRISFNQNSPKTTTTIENNTLIDNSRKSSIHTIQDTSDVDNDSDNASYATIEKPFKNYSNTNNRDSLEEFRTSGTYETIESNPCYYQVMATFDYIGQDDDELTMRKNDVILVLPWNSEDQMEDGWLFGENVDTKKKGLFPENHTARLDS